MKNTLLLSALIFFTFNSFAHKHTHHDDYEIRYINESMQMHNQVQENLRNNSPWQSFLSNYPQWFTYFNEYNYKPHRAFGSPIILSNGNSLEERFLSFVNTNLNDFNIPQDIVLTRKTENDKYINLDFTQYYNNLEIIDSRIYAKLTLDNKLVAFGLDVFSRILPRICKLNSKN